MKSLSSNLLGVAIAALLTLPAAMAADISGQWDWTNHTEGGDRPATPTFQLTGENVTGKWEGADVKGTFVGDKLDLSFPFTSPEGGLSGTLRLVGKLDGEILTGTWTFDQYSGTFRAIRKKAAAAAAAPTTASTGISGSWQCEVQTDRAISALLTIKADGDKLTGTIKSDDREFALLATKFEDGILSFQVQAGSTMVTFKMKPDGELITGTWTADGNSGPVKGKKLAA